jgi:Tfp pilus assembly protein PilF
MLQEPPPYSEKQLNELASVLGPICQSASELNTYGYVKMAAGEMAKAEAIFKLNLLLYPQTSNVFDSMGEYYENTHQPGLAMKCYQKELQLEPGNKSVQKKLDQLRTH